MHRQLNYIYFGYVVLSYPHTERAIARLKIFQILQFIRHDLYPYINKILVILSYTVNNFPPLLDDDEDQDFETFLSGLEKEDPDEEEFAINDQFIQDYEDEDDMTVN